MSKHKPSAPPQCPSAHVSTPGARLFGVQVRNNRGSRQLAYLTETQPINEHMMKLAGTAPPHEVLRVAAPCIEAACLHWEGNGCRLATRVATLMPQAVSSMPRCAIRPACLWFKQEGPAACLRCPGLSTLEQHAEDDLGAAVAQIRVRDEDAVPGACSKFCVRRITKREGTQYAEQSEEGCP
jgi:hypothetical protein